MSLTFKDPTMQALLENLLALYGVEGAEHTHTLATVPSIPVLANPEPAYVKLIEDSLKQAEFNVKALKGLLAFMEVSKHFDTTYIEDEQEQD